MAEKWDDMSQFQRPAGSPPQEERPPQQKKPRNEPWWQSWPLLIVLFMIGAWPIAIALMMIRFFGDKDSGTAGNAAGSARTGTASRPAAAAAPRGEPFRTDREKGRTVNAGGKRSGSSVKAAKTEKKRKTGKTSMLLRGFGIALAVAGLISGGDAIAGLLEGWSFYLEDLIDSIIMTAGGVAMFWRGQYVVDMQRRAERYLAALDDEEYMALSEIAKRMNRSPQKAARELQKLIDKGLLQDVYIDYEKGLFLHYGARIPREEEPPQPQAEEGYSGILRSIRRANDRIADEALSRKIDRLEQISGQIFKAVEEHPEKRQGMHTFFDYYLPTTQKLLDTYADFEETGVDGEHLTEAKKRIEDTMDMIVEGFEHQLDQLYSADAMDVFSDIKVMETMLNRDIASAARDFGYDRKSDKKDEDGGITLSR